MIQKFMKIEDDTFFQWSYVLDGCQGLLAEQLELVLSP